MGSIQQLVTSKRTTFRNVEYAISVSLINNDTLVAEVEEIPVGDKWKGQFSAKYIEEITQKTGNFKKFLVFVKMLVTSLTDASETVHIDLLTHEDLEMMKRTARPSSATPAQPPKNKRYLILTYVVQFDRVHYPLPLTFQDSPTPADLKATLRRLQDELAQVRREGQSSTELELRCQSLQATISAQGKEIDALRKQVLIQQQQLEAQQQLQQQQQHSPNGVGDLASLKERLGKLEDELEEEKAAHKRLMLHKNREYRILAEELENEKVACQELREEVISLKKGRTSDRSHRPPSADRGRFDPTAYVRDRKNKPNSRPQSVERQRPPSNDRTRPSRNPSVERFRPPSAERYRSPVGRRPSAERRPPSADRQRPPSADRQRGSRPPSTERQRTASRTSNASSRTASDYKTPSSARPSVSTDRRDRTTRPPSAERGRPPHQPPSGSIRSANGRNAPPSANGSNTSRSSSRERERGIPRVHSSPTPGSSYRSRPSSNDNVAVGNKKSQDKKNKWETEEDETDNSQSRNRAHSFGSNGSIAKRKDNSNHNNNDSNNSRSKYQINTHTRAVFGNGDIDEAHARKPPRVTRESYDSDSDSDTPTGGGPPVELSSQLSALQSFLIAQQRQKELKDVRILGNV